MQMVNIIMMYMDEYLFKEEYLNNLIAFLIDSLFGMIDWNDSSYCVRLITFIELGSL
jgi:hypothetical protein